MWRQTENLDLKMSEYVVDTDPSEGEALSSFSSMAGQGEGIYASPTSTDVGLQQRNGTGLTLSLKMKQGGKLPLDACKITDQDFEEVLKQIEPFLAIKERRARSFHAESIYGTRRLYTTAQNKRRKLSENLYKSSPQSLPSTLFTWPKSVSLFTETEQEPTEQLLQPNLGFLPLGPLHPTHDNQDHGDVGLCKKKQEVRAPTAVGSTDGVQQMKEDLGSISLPVNEVTEPLEVVNAQPEVCKNNQTASSNYRGISTLISDSSDTDKHIKHRTRFLQHAHCSENYENGSELIQSADIVDSPSRSGLWECDAPLDSIDKVNEKFWVSCRTAVQESESLRNADSAIYGVSKGSLSLSDQTIAGAAKAAAQKAANQTNRSYVVSQNSLGSPRRSSQTSTLVKIAKLFLQNSLKASSEAYLKALSSHHIPAELRQYFQALLSKFQSSELFHKAVIIYTMEQIGALPFNQGTNGIMPLKLRQGFDAVRKKVLTEELFKSSLEKFTLEYLGEMKTNEESGALELDLDELAEKMKPRILDGLSTEQLSKYCRRLETRLAYFITIARSAKEGTRLVTKRTEGNGNDKSQSDHSHPSYPNPLSGSWTCFRPQTTTNSNGKINECGRKNPFHTKKYVWIESTHCIKCNAPYDKSLESNHTKIGSKTRPNRDRSTTPATPRPLTEAQIKARDSAKPYIDAYHAANPPPNGSSKAPLNEFGISSSVHETSTSGTPTYHAYSSFSENDNPDTRYRSPGWHSEDSSVLHTPVSDRFHQALAGSSPENISGGSPGYSQGQISCPQTPSIGNLDALQINMNFERLVGESDEFVPSINQDRDPDIDSLFGDPDIDSLFGDSDIDSLFGEVEAHQGTKGLSEQTDMTQMESQQFPLNSFQPSTHYPRQVNLFPSQTGFNFQPQDLPPSWQPLPIMSGNSIGGPEYRSKSTSDQYFNNSGLMARLRPEQQTDNHPQSFPNRQFTDSSAIDPQLEQMDNHIQPYSGREFINSSLADLAGTQYSFPKSPGTDPIHSSSAVHLGIASSAKLHMNLKSIIPQLVAQADIQASLISSGRDQINHQATSPGMIANTNSGHPLHESPETPSRNNFPWPSRPGGPARAKKGGPGQGLSPTTMDSLSSKKRASPMKAQAPRQKSRLSRLKTTLAKEATPRKSVTKTLKPDKPLSQLRLAEVQASNSTSAMFLGGKRKIWEEQVPAGAAADQEGMHEAFMAEFDLLDRAAALGAQKYSGDGETGGDDNSRHSDRVIAVAAALAVAEESEESEEE